MPVRMCMKTMLAVEAVTDIAFVGAGQPVQAKDIAERQAVPPRFLEPVMQQLVRECVLRSVRGPRGGYTLARDQGEISVGDIVRVVSYMGKEDEVAPPASELRDGVIQPFWDETLGSINEILDRTTIADLCARARRNNGG